MMLASAIGLILLGLGIAVGAVKVIDHRKVLRDWDSAHFDNVAYDKKRQDERSEADRLERARTVVAEHARRFGWDEDRKVVELRHVHKRHVR